MLYYARRYDEALAELKQAVDIQPTPALLTGGLFGACCGRA